MYTINFFKGSVKYNKVKVIAPETESQLFTGVLSELYHKWFVDRCNEDLYAEVYNEEDRFIYDITYLKKGFGKIDIGKETYKFMAVEDYDLIFFI
jgi:hypothetical protein